MNDLGNRFSEKRVLITGACSGLGLALAKAFATRGWRVAMVDIQMNDLAIAEVERAGGQILSHQMDVCEPAAWHALKDQVVQAWGGLDILINNAGIGDAGTIFSVDEARWARVLDINLMGVVRGTATFAPILRDQGAGYVVNIASMAGLFAMPTMIAYNTSKAAVVSFSETLAAELHPHGIGVSCVCPHFFQTNIGESMAAHASPKTVAFLQRQMDRAGVTADQVAQTTIQGIARGRFLVFTHPGTWRQWLIKRLMPGRILAQSQAMAQKIYGPPASRH